MDYNRSRLESKVEKFGEVFVVLDSDREYIIHGTEGYEFVNEGSQFSTTEVRVEGMQDGDYVVAEFPLDAIEHIYTHKEV